MSSFEIKQKRIADLKETINFGAKLCRILLLLLFISITVNVVSISALHNAVTKETKAAPIIVGHGEMRQISDNMFEILDEKDLDCDCTLPPLPSHLKK